MFPPLLTSTSTLTRVIFLVWLRPGLDARGLGGVGADLRRSCVVAILGGGGGRGRDRRGCGVTVTLGLLTVVVSGRSAIIGIACEGEGARTRVLSFE